MSDFKKGLMQAHHLVYSVLLQIRIPTVLIEAFNFSLSFFLQDLESPPSSVTAVMKNGWLTNGFKETALHTAIWSVLKAKRRMLKNGHGFKAQVNVQG